MLKKINIGSKITSLMLLVVLITVAAISYIAYNFSISSVQDRFLNDLKGVASTKQQYTSNYFSTLFAAAELVAEQNQIQEALDLLDGGEVDEDSLIDAMNYEMAIYLGSISRKFNFEQILVADYNGKVLFSSSDGNDNQPGDFFNDKDGQTIAQSLKGNYLSKIYPNEDTYLLYGGIPISGNRGVVLIQSSMDRIYDHLQGIEEVGKTAEIMLVANYNNKSTVINPLRFDGEAMLEHGVYIGENYEIPLQEAVSGKEGTHISKDYRKKETLSVHKPIENTQWGLVVKVDMDEIKEEASLLIGRFFISGLIIVLICIIIGVVFSHFLTTPLTSLQNTLELLSKGVLPNSVKKQSNDEIGEMAEATNNLVQALKRTANFAHKIGQGDFDHKFTPLSKDDTLGTALLNMRNSIQEAEKRDKERNWIVEGVAEVGDILRSNDNLEELGDAIAAYVTEKINAIQGAFYVVNSEDKDDVFIEMKASYAYHKKKYLKAKFRFAEGLVGQAAIEQDTVLRTEIPNEYVTVTSGLLGDRRPTCILIVPLITDEKVFGVLEFAGFERFEDRQIKFVEEISIIIARTIFNIQVNARTRKLLEESQKMSNELQEQQEVLRQNAEEMEATQEELKRTNTQLEDQIEEVNRTQKRMQLLLENASEVISIYEKDGTVRYISPSVERILGYPSTEMIGQKDIDHIHPDGREAYDQMFNQLLENPDESLTVQYEYVKSNGDTIWVETTGNNLLDDPSIQGVLMNTRDITERKRAEQEERMRSKMQALSENSPDLITRLDQEGTVFYINPIIESYTGNKPDHFLRQTLDNVALQEEVKNAWEGLLKDVYESNKKIDREMEFPGSNMGDRIMSVNAIPEFDEDDKVESVLLVSHDITERKLIETEIQDKNKKITESINYAKRIQGAILPNNRVIQRALPESFIYYKPKDVVSGDFPWYMQVGDDIYIAAVDCTGHGVPGALISLIGYFLLNDIVRSRKISDPGLILDNLDEGVTQTLRQDQDDSQTKDGMDIALLKINKKKSEMEYAGAHRPLYYMKNDELVEFKGDKFPIGGGIYKNQTNFKNHKISYGYGDSVFFCSDGFPDQFGGPDDRKFGPKRLRELIKEVSHKPMAEVYDAVETAWEDWRGDQKQIDDVLLIGIKF